MALVVKDRVKETTATTGTGTVTLAGAVAGFQAFSSALSDGDTTYYAIFESSTGEWEVGLGTFTLTGTTLSRGTILESSNAGGAINLTAGDAEVFITYPAEKSVYLDSSGAATSAAGQINISDFNNDSGYATDINTLSDGYAVGGSVGLGSGALTNDDGSANNNVAVGTNALDTTTTGSYNVAIGYDADSTSATSSSQVIIGREARGTNVGAVAVGAYAQGNYLGVAIGFEASAGSTANNNLAAGYRAGYSVGSTYNVSIGHEAGYNSYNYNVSIGYRSSYYYSNTAYGVAIGFQAGYRDSGSSNIALGREAGYGSLGASGAFENISIGRSAGYDLYTGDYNVSIGSSAGTNITSGSENVSLGYFSGYFINSGTLNVAIGSQAADDLTTGSYNTALGGFALNVETTGEFNTALGYAAGRVSTTGIDNATSVGSYANYNHRSNENVAVGHRANYGNSTAGYGSNVAVGFQSGKDTNGTNNVFVGTETGLLQRLNPTANVFVGYKAGYGGSTTKSEGNVALGYQSGYALDGGTNNVLLGYASGDTITSGSNNIVIGYNADPTSATATNEITIGDANITRFRIPGAGIDNTSAALSGTTPSVDVGARDTYTLTTSGNTTFTFTGVPSTGQVGTVSLIITAGGTHTLTWPASVDWAGGTAPDAPASGETDIYTFTTIDNGTTWYGFLAGDAMA